MKTWVTILSLITCGCWASFAQTESRNSGAKLNAKWQTVVGDWIGEGEGAPGSGGGTSSFQYDLQQKVLVRRSHSEYPAANGRPATVHDDLMVICPGTEADQSRAMYFDNEGHVIEYTATWSAGGDVLTFISKPVANAPQFRLVYKKLDARSMTVSFDMAPVGQANAFKPYVSGKLHKKG